ncbi:uncharacterized protein LOC127440832 isoform X2 [Myxocyprinus asiaticus]|uniref:uncharacterized protein LOC127440832 isoform X2 n=1 Tax=Myxocyprinus asiaticus TaxID=70543 RepID=UPI002222324D|nr:uncharacterized protein LOC127440832 isoform X2 [Myxocyprinus asiaticus]
MDFIKEEREDMGYPEPHRVKDEETEEQIGLMEGKEESQELNEVEETRHFQMPYDYVTAEQSFSCSQTEMNFSQQTNQRTKVTNSFTCPQCAKSFKRKDHLKSNKQRSLRIFSPGRYSSSSTAAQGLHLQLLTRIAETQQTSVAENSRRFFTGKTVHLQPLLRCHSRGRNSAGNRIGSFKL